MKQTRKLEHLPPYLFARLDRVIHDKLQRGKDLIILSKSDPEKPTNAMIVESLREQAVQPENHHYPDFDGLAELRGRLAEWYAVKHGVTLDPEKEILPLAGSKEGIIHLCWALLDPGDIALIPDPAFPSYRTGTILAGAEPYDLPLRPPLFRPDFAAIPQEIARRAKLMFLNYPNNPSGATVDLAFWQEAVAFAAEHDLILINDHAYAMTCFRPGMAPSLLSTPGSRDRCLEFFTFSKAFHMAGWRLGAAVGNADILQSLRLIETHVNAGIFYPIQYAGAEALREGLKPNYFARDNADYQERLELLVKFFRQWGWQLNQPEATVYLWVPAPAGMDGDEFAQFLLEQADIVVSPGSGFGREGKGYVRFCVTYSTDSIRRAVEAMTRSFRRYGIHPPQPNAAR